MNVRSLLSRSKRKCTSRQAQVAHRGVKYAGAMVLLISVAMLLFSACTSPWAAPAKTGTPEPNAGYADTPTVDASPTAKATQGATITFHSSGCPSTLSVNWDKLVGTKAGVNKVQQVTCGPLEYGGLAAVVNVRYYAANAKLDVAVYDNLYGTPVKRFSLPGLIGGDAKISAVGTLITAENPTNDPLGANLFKEYQWNGSTYTQILFPGMYPDMTHYQAEQDQANVNAQLAQTTATPTAKQSVWQNSAFTVCSRMAQDLFHWNANSIKNTVVTYNSPSSTFIIQTTNYGPGGGGFVTSLFHLDNIATNIFEVKQVTSIDGTMLLNSPTNDLTQPLKSPVKVSGSYQSTGTILGRVALYDDTYYTVGDTGPIRGSASTGLASFAPSVGYHLSTRGVQEGLVAFFATNQNNISLSNQVVLAKVFFSV